MGQYTKGKGNCQEKFFRFLEEKGETHLTLKELSVEYRAHAQALEGRIRQLELRMEEEDTEERGRLEDRVRMLSVMLREARELAVLTERYYDRGYRRNARYTI